MRRTKKKITPRVKKRTVLTKEKGPATKRKKTLVRLKKLSRHRAVRPQKAVRRVSAHRAKAKAKPKLLALRKFHENPIIRPRSTHAWETKAAFNPAAVYEGGKVHILYRAIGESDTSVLGYAMSNDGFHIDERLDHPVYVPRTPFEGALFLRSIKNYVSPFASGGGGYGGCEDPRLTRIGNRLYLTYVAYNGWSDPRVALSSISLEDFLARRWDWTHPVLISAPNVVNKNACLFPEKIQGKYVMLHRVYPDILIDFLASLDFDGETKWLKGEYKISPRPSFWDSRKIGAGAPPLKTKWGWLLIYQAIGNQDPGRYKMGAMLLDLLDPTKVIARSDAPILEPEEYYENEGWKSGVAYPCGAVIIADRLIVYYGGADTVVCAADADLGAFVHELFTSHRPLLSRAASKRTAVVL